MNCAGVAQLVRASAFQAEGREFESRLPLTPLRGWWLRRSLARAAWAHVAQSVEHVLGKDGVTGSNPVVGLRWRGIERTRGRKAIGMLRDDRPQRATQNAGAVRPAETG